MVFRNIISIIVLFCATIGVEADDFILSYWCGPPTTENIQKRYAEVAEAGFNYAMIPCSGATVDGNKAALDACNKNGLKYIVGDSRINGADPSAASFKTNLDAVVAEYGKHPALGGYFLADEPAPPQFSKLAAINEHLLARDPKRLPFINLYPNYAPESAIGPYEKYVETFLTTVKPRLLSFDHYALMNDDSLRPNYFENLEIIRRQSLKHDVPFAFIFQLTPHFSYRDPTEADLRWQINTALAYGAKALLYFTYWTPTNDPAFKNTDAVIDRSGGRSPHFDRVKRLNAAINAWAPTLMKLESAAVYHMGSMPSATGALPEDAVVQPKETGAFILGAFEHQDGSEWWMVMNRDIRNPANVTLRFNPRIKQIRELSSANGKLSFVKLREHELPVELPAGGAKLFRLSR